MSNEDNRPELVGKEELLGFMGEVQAFVDGYPEGPYKEVHREEFSVDQLVEVPMGEMVYVFIYNRINDLTTTVVQEFRHREDVDRLEHLSSLQFFQGSRFGAYYMSPKGREVVNRQVFERFQKALSRAKG